MKTILSISIIPMLMSIFSCSGAKYIDMDVTEFGLLLKEQEAALIDVRTDKEYADGHIAGAANYDFYNKSFLSMVEEAYPKDKPLAVYCRSGRRSAGAAKQLAEAGYTVYNLKGGYMAWVEAGRRVTKYEVEVFKTKNGSPVAICLIKHGTLEIEYDGLTIHVDPVGEYGKHTDYAAEFPKADVILVTHEHPDHLDDAALKTLEGENTVLILNKTSADRIGRGEVIANGQSRELPKGITLDAVPAYNTTPGREKFHPKGNGNGYVLTIDGLRIYIAGDTEDVPEMANLKDIDVAFLPVNQPYTMTVEQCVNAANMFKPKVLIPYHFSKTEMSGLPGMLPDIKVLLRQMQ
ncbi:MAG: MBL fold metallo-hydrolase [Bacteroidales bacterium]|nr:MBL fold metallo-hydrolase [Bacteroidales bacterium]